MGLKTVKEKLIHDFKKLESFTTNDIHSFFSQTEYDIKRSTVNWRIHELVREGMLQRIGRGVYTLGKGRDYAWVIQKKQKGISQLIKKNFPLINFCCWPGNILKEFYQHIAKSDFLIVEAEKSAVDSVYHLLRESNRNTFKNPSKDIIEDFVLENRNSIIVRALISEAPLQNENGIMVPSLEKILVDLCAESEIFFFLQGKEIINVYRNAFGKYSINRDKMLRYAKRRNRKNEVEKIIQQIEADTAELKGNILK